MRFSTPQAKAMRLSEQPVSPLKGLERAPFVRFLSFSAARCFGVWLLIMVALPIAAQNTAPAITVDASQTFGEISPYVYGSNMNLYTTIPVSLTDEAAALELGYVRFGGGDTDRMDMRDSILDLFIFQTRQIGAQPAMSVRLLGGTPEDAVEIVRYANIEQDYAIRFWSIGNEPNLFVALQGAESYTAHDLAREWRAIAQAMLEVDPDIELVGPDITGYVVQDASDLDDLVYLPDSLGGDALDENGDDWLQVFLEANADLIDYVAIHRYPYPGLSGSAPTVDELRANPVEWETAIPNLRAVIRHVTGRDIPIAVTEVNSNSANTVGGEATLDSHMNALWMGDVLGRLIEQQVAIVAMWDIQGSSNRGWGIIGSFDVRPMYHMYRLYTHFGTQLVAADSTAQHVTAYAALTDDGALTVLAINMGDDPVSVPLTLHGFTPSGDAQVIRFDEQTDAAPVEPHALSDGAVLTLPARSMTMYVIPGS